MNAIVAFLVGANHFLTFNVTSGGVDWGNYGLCCLHALFVLYVLLATSLLPVSSVGIVNFPLID